ncbi:MAG: KH domain-containing protein [Spirochaetia bacterium]|nr:KH domain-containing protein [Spirochaetia bacterium]
MQILEIQAQNEKEALQIAAENLDISTDEIQASIQKKGASGFLGLGAKKPSIYQIDTIENKTSINAVIKGIVMTVLNKMGYKVKVIKIEKVEEDKIYIEISSAQAAYIIGKRGKTLESLQFLINLLVQQYTKEPPKLLLDIENYREKREKQLAELAKKFADYVIKTGRSRLMDQLNPYERRVVHMTLQENEKISTESEGVGVYKRIRIKLVKSESEKNLDVVDKSPDEDQADFADSQEEETIASEITNDSNEIITKENNQAEKVETEPAVSAETIENNN